MDTEISFTQFMEIMKILPTLQQIDEYCKYDYNLESFEYLESIGYFKFFTPIQKYHLFSTSCGYESNSISKLLYRNNLDLEALKEFMINFFAEVGGENEFDMFKWIWEKNDIDFKSDELIECFIKILKSGNLDFSKWFYSLNLIDIKSLEVKKKIENEFLFDANTHQDFKIAHWICTLYTIKI